MTVEIVDDVWAEEGGTRLKVEVDVGTGAVVLTVYGVDGGFTAKATISNWRWDRVIASMKKMAPADGGIQAGD